MAEKFVPKVLLLENIRVAFFRGFTAQGRTGRDGKPTGKPKYSMTALLDPSNAKHAEHIREIKAEGYRALLARYGSKENFPKPNPATGLGGLIYCYGNGNDLPKVYGGFKDMFYIKLSDQNRPLIGNRAGKLVAEGEPEAPYGGCYGNAKCTLYSYDNESRGVNANFRSLQYVSPGEGFGGGGARNPEEEFTPVTGAASGQLVAGETGKDPWDN